MSRTAQAFFGGVIATVAAGLLVKKILSSKQKAEEKNAYTKDQQELINEFNSAFASAKQQYSSDDYGLWNNGTGYLNLELIEALDFDTKPGEWVKFGFTMTGGRPCIILKSQTGVIAVFKRYSDNESVIAYQISNSLRGRFDEHNAPVGRCDLELMKKLLNPGKIRA